jgi:hypothetical protein
MRKYEFDVSMTITFVRTVNVDALDEEQAEYFAHADMRKEFGLDCEIEITETTKTGVAEDSRRRCEIQD